MSTPWFSIRGELPPRRRLLLTMASFLMPLGLWCLVSYVPPFAWHPDKILTIAGEREDTHTVYGHGDRVRASFFPTYRQGVGDYNAQLRQQLAQGTAPEASKREQLRTLRQLAGWGVYLGHLDREHTRDDERIFTLWRKLAEGSLPGAGLDPENKVIIQHNWRRLAPHGPDYEGSLPSEPLLRLLPQGRSANPIYLPAPHEVLIAGAYLFIDEPEGDQPTMPKRLGHSLIIVFSGFFLAALLGLPIGILAGTFPAASRLFEPFIDFFRYMPAPAFSTLLVAIFAAGDAPKIALVFLGTFFQLVLVVAKTTRQLDLSLLEAAQTLGADNRQLVTRVIIPGILPNLYNDLRILLGWAWTWLVIAELIGVKTGLTDFIETQGRWRNFDKVYPVIIMIGLIGFTTDQFLAFCRTFLFPWCGERRPGKFAMITMGLLAWPLLVVAWTRREVRGRAAHNAQEPPHER